MLTHTIYHIPGKKVGCTNNLKCRMTQYPEGTEFVKIMDLNDFSDKDAGQVEHWWQKLYGYRVDTVPYEKAIKNRLAGGKIGGHKNVESGHFASLKTTEHQSKAASMATKGKHWFNNGEKNINAFVCPDGFIPGMLPHSRRKKMRGA